MEIAISSTASLARMMELWERITLPATIFALERLGGIVEPVIRTAPRTLLRGLRTPFMRDSQRPVRRQYRRKLFE